MTEQMNIFDQEFEGLSSEEKLIWSIVREHRGKDHAIQVCELSREVNLPDRVVRGFVAKLRTEHGKLIGSRTTVKPGYYIITNREELNKYMASMRRRGIKILMAAAAAQKVSVEEVFKQGRLDLDKA